MASTGPIGIGADWDFNLGELRPSAPSASPSGGQEPGKWEWLQDWTMDPKKGGLAQLQNISGAYGQGRAAGHGFDAAAIGFDTKGIMAGINKAWAGAEIAMLPLTETVLDLNYAIDRTDIATRAIAYSSTLKTKYAKAGFIVEGVRGGGVEDTYLTMASMVLERYYEEKGRLDINHAINKFNYLELPKFALESRIIEGELAEDMADINVKLATRQADIATKSAKIQGGLSVIQAGASAYMAMVKAEGAREASQAPSAKKVKAKAPEKKIDIGKAFEPDWDFTLQD